MSAFISLCPPRRARSPWRQKRSLLAVWSRDWSWPRPPPGSESRRGGEKGSVIPFLALLIVAVGGLGLGLGRLGGAAVDAAQAQTAADAAALAGAAEGETAARELAGANGAELVAFVPEGPEVEVRARVGAAEAVARAARTPAPAPALGGGAPGGVAEDP